MTIQIYGREACPYCTRLVDLLKSKNVDFHYSDFYSETDSHQQMIRSKTKATTFPIVLINNVYVGGFDNISTILT